MTHNPESPFDVQYHDPAIAEMLTKIIARFHDRIADYEAHFDEQIQKLHKQKEAAKTQMLQQITNLEKKLHALKTGGDAE